MGIDTDSAAQRRMFLSLALLFFLHVCLPLPRHTPLEHQYNQGWVDYLDDEPSSFENLRLVWERDAGSFPTWLNGSYVKNGPARRGFGDGRTYSSYMDSWGKLHKFTFKDSPGPSTTLTGSCPRLECPFKMY